MNHHPSHQIFRKTKDACKWQGSKQSMYFQLPKIQGSSNVCHHWLSSEQRVALPKSCFHGNRKRSTLFNHQKHQFRFWGSWPRNVKLHSNHVPLKPDPGTPEVTALGGTIGHDWANKGVPVVPAWPGQSSLYQFQGRRTQNQRTAISSPGEILPSRPWINLISGQQCPGIGCGTTTTDSKMCSCHHQRPQRKG